MAQNTRMQQRYGTYSQFLADKNNLLPHEFASIASGDPNTSDGKSLNFAFGPGDTKRLMTAEDARDEIQAAASQATADAEESAQKAQNYYNQIAPAVENAKDELDNYTDALKSTIPLDYTELSEKVQQMEIMKAPVIQGKDSGEFVALSDSGNIPTKNVRLFGKSVQAETTGAQLFDVMAGKNEDESQYKITINDYATGAFTVSIGNPSGPLPIPKNTLSDWCPTMTAGKTYYLSGNADSTANEDIELNGVSGNWSFGTSRQITEEDLQSVVQFGFGTYSNIMIVEGTTEKPYEVYTGGEAATEPTPDFPLPITSVGNYDAEEEKYEIGINVDGANLLDYNDWKGAGITRGTGEYKDYGVVLVATENDCYTNYGSKDYKIFVLPNTEYCLSWVHTGNNGYVYVFENGIAGDSEHGHYIYATYRKLTFKTRSDTTYIKFRVGVATSGNTATYKNIQLNVGDTPLEFRPFQGTQQKVLQLPNHLRGIPVNSGGNYTDADGQQWICDVVELLTKTLTRYCGVKVFDGSSDENWVIDADTSTKVIRFSIEVENKLNNYNTSLCNRFKNVKGAWYMQDYGIYSDNTNGKTYFRPPNENVDTLNEWKSWLQSNPITVVYQLAIPTEESLTPDQIAALNLTTYQGITNIGTDTMPQVGVEVEYGCDTKIYIDNKFAELAQSLAATQNQVLGGN